MTPIDRHSGCYHPFLAVCCLSPSAGAVRLAQQTRMHPAVSSQVYASRRPARWDGNQ